MADPLAQKTVEDCLVRLGNYRVRRIQTVALEGEPDGISGALLLAFGLRETLLQNIIGGLRRLDDGRWIPETDPARQDVGVFQISRLWNGAALRRMPAVQTGTWGPLVDGKTAYDAYMVPRFEDSLQFTMSLLHEHMALADDAGVDELDDRVDIAIAAHNAGFSGALAGWRLGDVDRNTTQHDYVSWVKEHRTKVNRALNTDRLANWKVT
jgi:hypothetical protein